MEILFSVCTGKLGFRSIEGFARHVIHRGMREREREKGERERERERRERDLARKNFPQ